MHNVDIWCPVNFDKIKWFTFNKIMNFKIIFPNYIQFIWYVLWMTPTKYFKFLYLYYKMLLGCKKTLNYCLTIAIYASGCTIQWYRIIEIWRRNIIFCNNFHILYFTKVYISDFLQQLWQTFNSNKRTISNLLEEFIYMYVSVNLCNTWFY